MLEIRRSWALSTFPHRSVPLKGGRRDDFGSKPLFTGCPDFAAIAPSSFEVIRGLAAASDPQRPFPESLGGTGLAKQIEGHFLGASHSVGLAGFSCLPGRDCAFGVTPPRGNVRHALPAPFSNEPPPTELLYGYST
jgi:hypothetical protein